MPDRTLRIAVTSDAVRSRNGVGTYYDDLVQHLRDRVGAIELICPPAPDTRSASAGWSFRMPGDRTQTLFVPRIFRLWKEVRAVSAHVVVSPTPGLYGLVGMVAALGTGASFAVGYHTEFSELAGLYWERRPLVRGLMRRLALGVDWLMFRNAAAVLVYNRSLQESVRSRGVENALLLGTPVAASFLTEPLQPIPDRLTALTYVGRLAPEKRIDQILETARAIPEMRVRIVGDGPLRDQVEACRGECRNIDLFGWVDRDRVRGVLDKTDLLVLPSVHETFGTAALEALVRRRPVLVSPGCGIAEWPDLSGGLFRMQPGETLLEAVRRVRGLDPDERRAVAERGRSAAVRLHERTIDDWLDALGRAAAERAT